MQWCCGFFFSQKPPRKLGFYISHIPQIYGYTTLNCWNSFLNGEKWKFKANCGGLWYKQHRILVVIHLTLCTKHI